MTARRGSRCIGILMRRSSLDVTVNAYDTVIREEANAHAQQQADHRDLGRPAEQPRPAARLGREMGDRVVVVEVV